MLECIGYTNIPNVQRDELDKKVEVGIIIDYNNIMKGYMVYQPLANMVIIYVKSKD